MFTIYTSLRRLLMPFWPKKICGDLSMHVKSHSLFSEMQLNIHALPLTAVYLKCLWSVIEIRACMNKNALTLYADIIANSYFDFSVSLLVSV